MVKRRSNRDFSTDQNVLLQPWFLPGRIAYAIHEMVPPAYWN